MSRTARVLHLGLISASLFALAGAVGCQPNSTTTTTNNGGNAGDGGSGAGSNTGGTGAGSNTGGTGAGSNTGGTGAGGGTGGTGGVNNDACETDVVDATVYQVTDAGAAGAVGQGIKVRLQDVIAMSPKILISHSNNSESCLWGVFVSATKTTDGADLTETAPYSGVVVLSYGPNAKQGAPCLNQADAKAAGVAEKDWDVIPDDVKPGDVLKVVGNTSKFIQDACGSKPADSDIEQAQIFEPCKVEKTGEMGIVPAPHELTAAELVLSAKQKSSEAGVLAFHDSWAGVRVRAPNVTPVQFSGQTCGNNGNQFCCPPGVDQCTVDPYGTVKLAQGDVLVPDILYYLKEGEKGGGELCHVAAKFPNEPPPMWSFIDGFHQLNFCTWVLAPVDKCADYNPQPDDCKAASVTACFEK